MEKREVLTEQVNNILDYVKEDIMSLIKSLPDEALSPVENDNYTFAKAFISAYGARLKSEYEPLGTQGKQIAEELTSQFVTDWNLD